MSHLLLAGFAAVSMFVSSAQAEPDEIVAQLNQADVSMGKEGLSPMGFLQRGELSSGGASNFRLTIAKAGVVSFVGACDTACGNLDLQLFDAAGKVVIEDIADDDVPIMVSEVPAGGYTLKVSMPKCTGQCRFAVKGYSGS